MSRNILVKKLSAILLFFPCLIWIGFLSGRAFASPLGGIATQHPLATAAAARVLREGGNAIDAAVAAALTLSVVEPYNSGLGGGGMALVWIEGEKKPHALDFRETSPQELKAEFFQRPGSPPDASEAGPYAIAVPGELKGLAELHSRWGKLPWKNLFPEAIHWAEQGWPDPLLRSRALEKKECLQRDYDSFRLYEGLLSGKNPGATLQQKDLAKTLALLRDHGADVFYQGPLGERLSQALHSKGSPIQTSDLQNYRAVEREPLLGKFSWGSLWGMPPPSSGGVSVILGMNLFEELKKKMKKDFPNQWAQWWLPSLGKIFSLRNSEMGDPDFGASMPVQDWIGKKAAKQWVDQAWKNPSAALELAQAESTKSDGHTTHLSVIDAQGNAVSMTLTLNLSFGSCMTAGDTGIMMNDEIDDFTVHPEAPNAFGLVQSSRNAIEAGKRPLSSMSPTLVSDGHGVRLALGSPGGPKIITSVFITLLRFYGLNESLDTAVAAPRIHFQGEPRKISVEKSYETEVGWKNLPLPTETVSNIGNIQAVSRDPKKNLFEATSDPRGKGKAEVVQP